MSHRIIYFLGLLLVFPACQQPVSNHSDKASLFIDSLMSEMTLEEKIGQMTMFTSGWDVTGPVLNKDHQAELHEGKIGALFNAHTAEYNRNLQRIAVEETRLGIPLLFGYDVIHGYKTIFPIPLGEAASWDLEAMELSAQIAAREATAAGVNWTFAPMVDISRDPRWGRMTEGAGEDPYLGSAIARAKVRGFQGDDLRANNTLLACAKHFAAYGAAEAGRDYHTVDMSERQLREVYLPPFKAALDAGASTFMTAFNELDGVPASGNYHLLTRILRDEWGFEGFVVTDYTSINEMVPHGIAEDLKAAGELAVNSGVDMDMQGAVYAENLADLIEEGKVSLDKINDAVRRILQMKYKLGLFDDPYRYGDTLREKQEIFSEANQQAARDIARKSLVLLKNKDQVLPISKKIKSLAVIGPLADSKVDMLGSWAAAGESQGCITLLAGLRAQLSPSTQIRYARGCDFEDNSKAGFAEALAIARQSELIILAVGESRGMSGEAASRSQIGLPGVQQELLEQLATTGKPIITVLMNGRPLVIPELVEQSSAVLETWFSGSQGGNAIADVLLGVYNPSGKLPVTFPRNEGQIPLYYSQKNSGRPYDKNNHYTSQYMDIPNAALFPFGFGLSYTTFEYADLQVDRDTFTMKDSLLVSIHVSNTGEMAGEEIVQFYIQDLYGNVTRPIKELKGFRKIMLKPGETQQVSFQLRPGDLAFYHRNMDFKAEAGEFKLFIGRDSDVSEFLNIYLLP